MLYKTRDIKIKPVLILLMVVCPSFTLLYHTAK